MNTERRNRRQKGFTLAELMVVIVIIGLLATLVASDVMGIFTDAKKQKVKSDILAIEEALTIYSMRNGGDYPNSLEVLIEKDENGHRILNRTALPKDPWGREYMFDEPIGTDDLRVYTYGRDGMPGGEGEDGDYSNLDLKAE